MEIMRIKIFLFHLFHNKETTSNIREDIQKNFQISDVGCVENWKKENIKLLK